jgi:hypothetical protein
MDYETEKKRSCFLFPRTTDCYPTIEESLLTILCDVNFITTVRLASSDILIAYLSKCPAFWNQGLRW